MTAAHPLSRATARRVQWAATLAAALIAVTLCASTGRAQPASAAKPGRPAVTASGNQWQELTPAQKQFLQPLERDWPTLESRQKSKWVLLSSRAPAMSGDERRRIQARMTEWATLTSDQRSQARLRYQEARQLPAVDRQARWDAYQSLPPEQKQRLAARAAQPSAPARPASGGAAGGAAGAMVGGATGAASSTRSERAASREPLKKSNIVPNPALAAPPKPIGPALVQARPGATTNLITKRASPPSHQQTGMPKIAATPEFVDKATLLPQRGPQGTAGRKTAAAASGAAAVSGSGAAAVSGLGAATVSGAGSAAVPGARATAAPAAGSAAVPGTRAAAASAAGSGARTGAGAASPR